MINRVILTGRMVRDPEIKTTSTGKSVASFTIAVSKRIKPKDWKEPDAHFFRVQAWGQTAEYVTSYLGKGRLVAVDGRLEQHNYTDKNGNKRETFEVVADIVQALDRPRDDGSPASAKPQTNEDDYDPFEEE